MKVKCSVRAGGRSLNHSQTTKGLRVKSQVKAGGRGLNHNQNVARAA